MVLSERVLRSVFNDIVFFTSLGSLEIGSSLRCSMIAFSVSFSVEGSSEGSSVKYSFLGSLVIVFFPVSLVIRPSLVLLVVGSFLERVLPLFRSF